MRGRRVNGGEDSDQQVQGDPYRNLGWGDGLWEEGSVAKAAEKLVASSCGHSASKKKKTFRGLGWPGPNSEEPMLQ